MGLEFKIGGLKINPDKIRDSGPLDLDPPHSFVIQYSENAVYIYIAELRGHSAVVAAFDLSETFWCPIVGGGSCYLNKKEQFILRGFSGGYGAIPRKAGEKFAELVAEELKKQNFPVKEGREKIIDIGINKFWNDYKDLE